MRIRQYLQLILLNRSSKTLTSSFQTHFEKQKKKKNSRFFATNAGSYFHSLHNEIVLFPQHCSAVMDSRWMNTLLFAVLRTIHKSKARSIQNIKALFSLTIKGIEFIMTGKPWWLEQFIPDRAGPCSARWFKMCE